MAKRLPTRNDVFWRSAKEESLLRRTSRCLVALETVIEKFTCRTGFACSNEIQNVMARSVALYVERSRHDGNAFTMTVLLVLTIEVFL